MTDSSPGCTGVRVQEDGQAGGGRDMAAGEEGHESSSSSKSSPSHGDDVSEKSRQMDLKHFREQWRREMGPAVCRTSSDFVTATPSVVVVGTTTPSSDVVGTTTPSSDVVGTTTPSSDVVGTTTPSSDVVGTTTPSRDVVGTTTPSSDVVGTTTPSSDVVGTTTPSSDVVGTTTPSSDVVGTTTPGDVVGTTTPDDVVGTTTPGDVVGTTAPSVGTTTPSVGTTTPSVGTTTPGCRLVDAQQPASCTPAHTADTSASMERAVSLYLAGMELEQKGHMYDAIRQYRRAVQCEPGVEAAIRHILSDQGQQSPAAHTDGGSEECSSGDVQNDLSGDGGGDEEPADPDTTVEESLVVSFQRLLAGEDRFCATALPTQETHIGQLPGELVRLLLRWLVSCDVDVRSLEQMALVSRGCYLFCRDPALWKRICTSVLGASCVASMAAGSPLQPIDWRRVYLSRPHLHYTGCYIARSTYVRSGESTGYQDANYRPWHMVVYHRVLRFMADGRVLMLISSDDPASCVAALRGPPTSVLRNPLVVAGQYRLKGERVVAVLKKPREPPRKTRTRIRDRFVYDPGEQTLHLELTIEPYKRDGQQLVWLGYRIATQYRGGPETSATVALSDQFPPLVYSRVRSYAASSDAPIR